MLRLFSGIKITSTGKLKLFVKFGLVIGLIPKVDYSYSTLISPAIPGSYIIETDNGRADLPLDL